MAFIWEHACWPLGLQFEFVISYVDLNSSASSSDLEASFTTTDDFVGGILLTWRKPVIIFGCKHLFSINIHMKSWKLRTVTSNVPTHWCWKSSIAVFTGTIPQGVYCEQSQQQQQQHQQPTTNNQQPTTNNQQTTTNNQQPTNNNQQPTTNNQPTNNQPTTNNQQPTTNKRRPTTTKTATNPPSAMFATSPIDLLEVIPFGWTRLWYVPLAQVLVRGTWENGKTDDGRATTVYYCEV